MSDHLKSCACGSAPKLIFPCSGAADVGAIADQAARKLSREGAGKMFCLAGIGGRVDGIVKSTEAAAKILVIDGCPLQCAKKTLENAGFMQFEYVNLSELGMTKGQTEPNDANISRVAEVGNDKLICR